MSNSELAELDFPGVSFGPMETRWNLEIWLYRRGAQTPVRKAKSLIAEGALGAPLADRIELVHRIHETLLNYLQGGGRMETVRSTLERMKHFFKWADESDSRTLEIANMEKRYQEWCASLLHRTRIKNDLKERTAHDYRTRIGWLLDRILGRESAISRTTLFKQRSRSNRAVSPKADKQSLEKTFAFGHLLLDLADGLSVDAIWGKLPVEIPLRNGRILKEWSGLKSPENLKPPNPKYPNQHDYLAKKAEMKRAAWQAEKSYRTRFPLINIRIMVELFMLLGQPAVNLAQAYTLRMDQWRFKSSNHGYEIRTYKHRRLGPVVFEIYSEYRILFERYLQWRKAIFPNDPDGLLFPFLGNTGGKIQRRMDQCPDFGLLRRLCKSAGVEFIGPQALRNTNVNWMLRRTGDPDLTAAEKQHATRTLLNVYEKPSLQRAMVQTQIFWAQYDPSLATPGPGSCEGRAAEPLHETPLYATQPDCITPSGCLFCVHQRDIDSFDYVWSLASFRFLKSFEIRALTPDERKSTATHPAELTIERITTKLNLIQASNSDRSRWVEEAVLRLEEGQYHPAWVGLIESL